MLAVAAGIAKQERLRISDRTKAGMERARKQGKHCGRPPVVFWRDRARTSPGRHELARYRPQNAGCTVRRALNGAVPKG